MAPITKRRELELVGLTIVIDCIGRMRCQLGVGWLDCS